LDLTWNLLKEHYCINQQVIELAGKVQNDIEPCLRKINDLTEYNQLKVITAMKDSGLSDFHLTDSTGYGYNDEGRNTIEEIYKAVFKAEDALVRPQIISGTHAIALCLFGILRPNNELISVTGTPYDTLKDVIWGKNCSSLADFNIKYSEVDLKDGKPDYEQITSKINRDTRMVLIQRSRGYSLRPALRPDEIGELIRHIKGIKKDIICLVDNCYGEFVDTKEPTEVGADLCAGSLIKNPGGGIAPTGGYVVGRKDLIKQCSYRLSAPGLGKNCGPTLSTNRLTIQGLFFAPLVVGEALKGAAFTSRFMELAGFKVFPKYDDKRGDIVTAVVFENKNLLISFCRGIQKIGPVDSHVSPEPWDMPGYNHQVIMAGGSFIQGSSIELSIDAPIREPFVAYIQGGTNFTNVKLGIMKAYQELIDQHYIN
jgi:cystathionine beta-lyase family protein involved in aluminum resistance